MAAQKVPLLDLKAQFAPLRGDVLEAIARVCDAQHFILGSEVEGLERELEGFLGIPHAVGVSSGTDALLAALMALDVGAGDEVVTTPFSFFATAGSIARLGARPVFVDIDRATFNIDASAVASAMTSKTKAIMPVHLFGQSADMAPILEISERSGVPVSRTPPRRSGRAIAAGPSAASVRSAASRFFRRRTSVRSAMRAWSPHPMVHSLASCARSGSMAAR